MNAARLSKFPLHGTIVKAMFHTRIDRGMRLIEHGTRCIRRGELHELVTTDQTGLGLGDRVDRVGFLGFMEAQGPGVIERGDRLLVAGRLLGTVVGFDDCHFPNHYNVLIETESLLTANSWADFGPGTSVHFEGS